MPEPEPNETPTLLPLVFKLVPLKVTVPPLASKMLPTTMP